MFNKCQVLVCLSNDNFFACSRTIIWQSQGEIWFSTWTIPFFVFHLKDWKISTFSIEIYAKILHLQQNILSRRHWTNKISLSHPFQNVVEDFYYKIFYFCEWQVVFKKIRHQNQMFSMFFEKSSLSSQNINIYYSLIQNCITIFIHKVNQV